MALQTYRLGTPRKSKEGIRIGVVRFLPRGVRKADYATKNYFDTWLPQLAPSKELLQWFKEEAVDERRWATFAKRYRREMDTPANRQLIALLAAFTRQSALSIGCHCEDESHCHRSLLAGLIEEAQS